MTGVEAWLPTAHDGKDSRLTQMLPKAGWRDAKFRISYCFYPSRESMRRLNLEINFPQLPNEPVSSKIHQISVICLG